ncbi:hypothetical protein HOD15_02030 [Candidatus Peregrinibacteria bacterium]|nr:hypothetical protein [Candidatus Peregrinibacteria bacterium]
MPKKSNKTIKDPSLVKEIRALTESEKSLEKELVREMLLLAKEIGKIKQMEVIKIFRHPWKFLGLSMVKGIMVGFGSVLGATVFLSIFIYLLARISLVPFVGDFVESVMAEIQGPAQEEQSSDSDIFEQYKKAQQEIETEN